MRQFLQILFIGLLHSLFTWSLVMGQCDTSNCPVLCSGPCAGSPGPIDLNPTGPPVSCQELIIESPGYPNGYLDNQCIWMFRMRLNTGGVRASIVINFLDFDVDTGDNLVIEGVRGNNAPEQIFNDDTSGEQISDHVNTLEVRFSPSATLYDRRGFRLRVMFSIRSSAVACIGTQTLQMSDEMPSAALNSPRYPNRYQLGSECYYTIISPSDTHINLEFMGTFDIEAFQDFVYIYDGSNSAEPNLLRIVSQNDLPQWTHIQTKTNQVQIAFKESSPNRENGFFIRATFEEAVQDCSGNGVLNNMCSCSDIDDGPICNFDSSNDYEPITPPAPPISTSSCGLTIQLSYDSSNANALLYPNSYLNGGTVDANPCVWNINGPEGSHHAIIFQDFQLEHDVDRLRILYTDGRDSDGFILYSSSITDLPYMRSGATPTFNLVETPIIIDSHMFQIIYSGNTADLNVNSGPVIEVHLLGVGICSTPCLNGGQCSASCDCNDGFQGQVCEQTTPQDYTCLVKNAYVKPHFAYPVQLYAIAGTNTISSDSFNFHVYNYEGSYTYKNLPPNAVTDIVSFGRVLSLPSTCDSKSAGSSRIQALACFFEEDDFNEAIEIPAIVNPKSDLLSPVGRFTRTVSINDAEVTLSVQHIATKQYALRWRLNGKLQQKWNGQSSITITNIKAEDGGIYECFIRGGSDYDVVIYRLIVRGCPDNMYGPDCAQTCPTCQNGGTCSDVYGTCICPPGYAGAVCDELLTGNTISRNAELTCSGLGITYPRCKYVMMCLPDPGGCMCMSGWLGSYCDKPCPPLKFGLECQFDCHCNSGDQCDVATGECPNGCDASFTGSNCQTI